jgi:hypothetical protein
MPAVAPHILVALIIYFDASTLPAGKVEWGPETCYNLRG